MKKIFHRNLNNRGASFIMVVIALGFIAVLGTIVISAAVKNVEMKMVNKKSKENFYSAEAALEEIKAGITEIAADEMSQAYETVLKEYSTNNTAMRNKIFRTAFLNGIKGELQVSAADNTIPSLILTGLLKETRKAEGALNGAEIDSTPIFDVLGGTESVKIKGIKVVFSLDGYTSSITTDLKIMIPAISFRKSTGGSARMPYKEYALIGNRAILAGFSSHRVTGNVYAGNEGIQVSNEGNTLEINGGEIISSGDISVIDKSKLWIYGTDTEVWATNLLTSQSDKRENSNLETSIHIDGKSYIKDDLILDAKKSSVELEGEYYGYSNGTGPANNSAIMINAMNASLKLDGLNKLYLAGRAFISLENSNVSYEIDPSHGADAEANSNILTGESLAVKGSQGAYLLPADFIAAGHNPITWEEYIDYYNNTNKNLISVSENSIIFKDPSISEDESKLFYYVDSLNPVKKAFYKFGTDLNVVYYYMNFKSDELATTYLKNYEICYPEKLYNGFPISDITINNSTDAIFTAGNLLTYSGNLDVVQGNNGDFYNNYELQFENLTKTLEKNIAGEGTVFDNLIHGDRIVSDGAVNGGQALLQNDTYYINVVDNKSFGVPLFFNEYNKEGIIIATGDVEVCADFKGLIISGGKITLYNGADIDAGPDLISNILSDNNNLRRYFKGFDSYEEEEEAASSVHELDFAELIQYENWKKN